MSDDLTDRLRDRRVCSPAQNSCRNDYICDLAADRIEELEAKLAEAVECFGPCITLLDGLVHESKREIEWGEEDAFRMGEWFENDDLERLESARNAIAELSSVSCANLKGKTDE